MEIKVNSNELAKRLEQATKVVSKKNVLPILSNVIIETKGDVMILTTSDAEVWLSLKCKADSGNQNVKFCVNAHDMFGFVKNIDDKEIVILLNEEEYTITCNYGNGNFAMPYFGVDEFPSAVTNQGKETEFIVEGKKILNAIELTSFATSNSPIRPVLNGINFNFREDGLTVSASDQFKIAIYKDKSTTSREVGNFTLPQKPYTILSSILGGVDGNIKISTCGSSITINNADFKLTARLLEENFPDCERFVPSSSPIIATVDKVLLVQALQRVSLMSDELSNLVVLQFEKGRVTLSADNTSYRNSASETITCDCDSEIKIGFKASSLIDVLRNIDDDNVVIEMTDSRKGVVLYTSSTYSRNEYVCMLSPFVI